MMRGFEMIGAERDDLMRRGKPPAVFRTAHAASADVPRGQQWNICSMVIAYSACTRMLSRAGG